MALERVDKGFIVCIMKVIYNWIQYIYMLDKVIITDS